MPTNPLNENDKHPRVDPLGVHQGATQDQVDPRGVPHVAAPTYAGQALPDIDAHWREYLARAAQLRAVRDGLADGWSVAAVADALGISVEVAEEMAAVVDRGADVEASAYEIVVRAHVEGGDRRTLVERLSGGEYSADSSTALSS